MQDQLDQALSRLGDAISDPFHHRPSPSANADPVIQRTSELYHTPVVAMRASRTGRTPRRADAVLPIGRRTPGRLFDSAPDSLRACGRVSSSASEQSDETISPARPALRRCQGYSSARCCCSTDNNNVHLPRTVDLDRIVLARPTGVATRYGAGISRRRCRTRRTSWSSARAPWAARCLTFSPARDPMAKARRWCAWRPRTSEAAPVAGTADSEQYRQR